VIPPSPAVGTPRRRTSRLAALLLAPLAGLAPLVAGCAASSGHGIDPSHAGIDVSYHAQNPPTEAAAADRLQRAALRYFQEQRHPHSGLIANTTEANAPASPTAAGVALSAIPIAVSRGWLSRDAGYQEALAVLHGLERAEHVRGFFYHFLVPSTGQRTWESEVSPIDSAIAFAGAMVAAEFFPETEVAERANRLIERAEWPWFLDGEDTLQWGWKPETGFEGGPMDFSESVLAYLLAIGSPTHPIPAAAWTAMRRPISRYGDLPRMVYTRDGSLFAYVLPLAWFDLRDRHDAYLDYWTNAETAIRANLQFCRDRRHRVQTYREGLWGLSAALGPDGYTAYGAEPGVVTHDGTVAPYVVAASVPWLPQASFETLHRMEQLAPSLWTRYGYGDGLNIDRQFVCPYTIALDQGLAALLIENYRTGLIWDLFMRHPIAQRALERAEFLPGALAEPLAPEVIPGNPGASLSLARRTHPVAVDGDLSEWIRDDALELTPRERRNVEYGFVSDARDASAVIYLGWDDDAFYVAGLLTDETLVTRKTGGDIYLDDCLEVFFDLDGDGFRFDRNPSDVQIGVAPGGPEGTHQLWAWGAIQQYPSDVQAAVERQGEQVAVELAIPRARLPGLREGQPVRFSVAYHDRDADEKAAKLHWSVDTATKPGTILFGYLTLSSGADEQTP